MKFDISNRSKTGKYRFVEIKQHILKQPTDQRRNHNEIRKYLEVNENETTIYQNLQDSENIFIAISINIKKEERSPINNLTLQLKELGKKN